MKKVKKKKEKTRSLLLLDAMRELGFILKPPQSVSNSNCYEGDMLKNMVSCGGVWVNGEVLTNDCVLVKTGDIISLGKEGNAISRTVGVK